MDTEVFPILEAGEHRIGNSANTELQAGAILNQRGNVLAYLTGSLIN